MYTVASTSQLCLGLRHTLHISCRSFRRTRPPPGKIPSKPPSKTRRYDVRQLPAVPAAEVKELLWRRGAYNDAMAAIRLHLRQTVQREEELGDELAQLRKDEAREFKKVLRENDMKNAAVQEKRNVHEKELMSRLQEDTMADVKEFMRVQKLELQKQTEHVKSVIASSESWVTEENLMSKIEEALENPKSFDFAIDRRGGLMETPVMAKYVDKTPAHPQRRMYEHSYVTKKDKEATEVDEPDVQGGETQSTG